MNTFDFYEILNPNADELKKLMINKFQELSGRKLSEASPETLIFSSVAYVLALREENYNDVAKQNYLKFARNERLDLKGEIYGIRGKRLVNQAANATFRFHISEAQNTDIVIPKGSLIQYENLYFSTNDEYKIPSGLTSVDGIATCNSVGMIGNNIPVGQIKTMVDIYPYYSKVENITVSNGGTDKEDDDAYRERIRTLPESFSTAGPEGAYVFWVKSISPEIIDVKVVSERPCEVDIYPWTKGGIATPELKKRILEIVNDSNIAPLTDKINIKDPLIVNYDINLDYYIDKENESFVSTIKQKVNLTIAEYNLWQKNKLGRDINPDELIKKLKDIGVKRIVLRNPTFIKLESNKIGVVRNITTNYLGVEEI